MLRLINKYFSDFLTNPLRSNIFLTPALPDEIQAMIKSLYHKAIGSNSIPIKVLKVFDKTISIPLANLINLFFEHGIFLMPHKVVSVAPIHKKGDSLDSNTVKPVYNNHSKVVVLERWLSYKTPLQNNR